MTMQFMEKEIHQFLGMIWEAQLNLPLQPRPLAPEAPPECTCRCAIQISGGWNGWLVMDFSPELARQASERFFGVSEPKQPAEVEETLKELANQVGGNLKNLFSGPTRLMFPVVSLDGPSLYFPDTQLKTRLGFFSNNQPLEIRLLEYALVPDPS